MGTPLFKEMYPNFSRSEFACPCKKQSCPQFGMKHYFLAAIQDLRLQTAMPIEINSGFRCVEYNRTVLHSSPQSMHVDGLAADISIRKLSPYQKHRLFKKAFLRFNGIGIYKEFLHLDLRSPHEKVVWIGH